ncbi:MAG TPA: BON domain-containing protein [Vicinamibacterales bacterium]
MIGTLLRTILIVLIVVGAAAFFMGYRWADDDVDPVVDRPIGTTGARDTSVDTSRARETGAEIGEKVAVGVNAAERAAVNAAVTAKIKSKMALDDTVKAVAIDVDTDGTVVTLSGRVVSAAEHQRAVQLARETEGVTSVVDKLVVR